MLQVIGVDSIDDLFAAIPADLRTCVLDMAPGIPESELAPKVTALADANRTYGSRSFLGAGCYQIYVPAAVRALTARSEFTTSYTPYQAEVSQGTLQHIFEFQTAICELTALEVANASMYDGPSALAEGAFLAARHTRRDRIVVSAAVHPEAAEVLRTYSSGPGLPVTDSTVDPATGRTNPPTPEELEGAAALVVQQPNFFGVIEDLALLADAAHAAGALLVVSQGLLAAGVLSPPGAEGADVAVGDVQPIGNPPQFGGPSAGFLACRDQFIRQLPGRLVGKTVDADRRVCFSLTLQAREQHIRREKATSNICSNQALAALAATIHLALLGPVGLRQLGEVCVTRAHSLCDRLTRIDGFEPLFSGTFFHEFTLRVAGGAESFAAGMRRLGVDPGVPLGRFRPEWSDLLLVAVTEMNGPDDLTAYVEAAREVMGDGKATGERSRR
ncbi:MAG: aminomethyl-transferring glycine dehydrogenase subunit GcvPA [Actinobacteria bacterium]|nr:aminomethyl-transferring glycine dehydrogenase subunit GcvPA [Actinomycetota bacterium]